MLVGRNDEWNEIAVLTREVIRVLRSVGLWFSPGKSVVLTASLFMKVVGLRSSDMPMSFVGSLLGSGRSSVARSQGPE